MKPGTAPKEHATLQRQEGHRRTPEPSLLRAHLALKRTKRTNPGRRHGSGAARASTPIPYSFTFRVSVLR